MEIQAGNWGGWAPLGKWDSLSLTLESDWGENKSMTGRGLSLPQSWKVAKTG